ncbi:MAG: hypothetical protein ACXWJ5_09195 [Xanthobacteraceae bacterium]
MTSPLDDISFKLGELSAGQAMLIQRANKRDGEMAEFRKLLGEIKTKMDPLVDDVVWMKPQVRHYSGVRKRGAWVASLIVGVAGIFGGAVGNWFLKKYGG